MTDFSPDPETTPSALGLQFMGALRDLLKVIGASMVAHGYMSQTYVEPIIGVLMVAGPMVWSQYVIAAKRRQLQAAKASNPKP